MCLLLLVQTPNDGNNKPSQQRLKKVNVVSENANGLAFVRCKKHSESRRRNNEVKSILGITRTDQNELTCDVRGKNPSIVLWEAKGEIFRYCPSLKRF